MNRELKKVRAARFGPFQLLFQFPIIDETLVSGE